MTAHGASPVNTRVLAVRCDFASIRTIQLVADGCGALTQVVDDVFAAIAATARWLPGLVLLPVAEATGNLVPALRSAGRFDLVLLGSASPATAAVADAVLPLPLSAPKLAMRIALSLPIAAFHPTQGGAAPDVNRRYLRVGRVELDLLSRTVVVLGRPDAVHLTGRESELLHDLMSHVGRLRSRVDLLWAVWGIDFQATTTVVEVTMSRLRAKTHLAELHTTRTTGYCFTSVESSPALRGN